MKKSQVLKKDVEKNNKLKNRKMFTYSMELESQISMSDKTKERIKECASFMEFLTDFEKEHKKIANGNFCKNRFCPICSKRKATKEYIALLAMSKYIEKEHKKAFIFLTLTVPNCEPDKLDETVRRMNSSFNRLFKRSGVLKVVKGHVKKLEVTYNHESNTFHPHFHVLIAVNKSYFTDKTYLSRDKWLELWKESYRDDTITQVDVRRITNLEKSILEISKYLSKDSDYLISKEVFKYFYNGLKGKQYMSFGLLFADARKKYKAGELNYLLDDPGIDFYYLLTLEWNELESEYKKEYKELSEVSEGKLNWLLNKLQLQLIDDDI